MKFKNPFVEQIALVLMAIHIGGVLSMNYDFFTTTFGFKDITINGTMYNLIEDVEFIMSAFKELTNCPGDFVLSSQSILSIFPEELKERWHCRLGVRHEANMSKQVLTEEEASNVTFVIDKIKELDFYWYLNGKGLEANDIDDIDNRIYKSPDTRVLQRAFNTILEEGRIIAVPDGAYPMNCCMRNPFLPASRVPSYPEFPAAGVGRHDVVIKEHVYKNIPYVATMDSVCPYGMKDAIVTIKDFPFFCPVSAAFAGSPTPLPGEDPEDLKVKRSRFQWIFDGKPAGNIPDELWNPSEPSPSFESLQNATISTGDSGLYAYDSREGRCCMDLAAATTTTTIVYTRPDAEITTPNSVVCHFFFTAILFYLTAIDAF